jgi:hypothetical protein
MPATAKTKGNQPTDLAAVILFGIDSSGKPKAARFGTNHARLAAKAATQLQLQVLPGTDPTVAAIAARLPVGRIHASGRMFVPFVRRDLYDKLVAAAPNGGPGQHAAPPPSGTGGHAGGKPTGSPPSLPRTWTEIGVGDLVIAHENADEGWYEAIVVDVDNDMVTLRWRDYPRQRQIVRHRNRLGLLRPVPSASAQPTKPSKPAATKDGTPASSHSSKTKSLPSSWDEIDTAHLVLAKTDGPWGSWYEAVAIAVAGDELTLRWRDNHGNVAPISRGRSQLALIRPDAV